MKLLRFVPLWVGLALGLLGSRAYAQLNLSSIERELREGLQLSIEEQGPGRPWTVRVVNRGPRAVSLVKDPRLLRFVVKVPGKRKKEVECQLPSTMLPIRAESERLRELEPEEGIRFRIDPRFYCFDEGDQRTLVPGAQIEARYGWPERFKIRWRGGRKHRERLAPTPPYVAQLIEQLGPIEEDEAEDTETSPDASQEEPSSQEDPRKEEEAAPAADAPLPAEEETREPRPHNPDERGLKETLPFQLSLGSEYESWARTREERREDAEGLELTVLRGSDSTTANGARVTVQLKNTGRRTQHIYLRRELLSFYLLGPDGLSVCGGEEGELRAPDAQSYTTLRPGRSITLVTRLLELCPNELLNRPGFFFVGAELRATQDGSEAGINAFTGTVYTTQGKPVRVHKGDLPFVHRDLPRRGITFRRGGRLGGSASDAPPGPPTEGSSDASSSGDSSTNSTSSSAE